MANYTYDNKVIEDKYNSVLNTYIDVNSYMTVDNSLAAQAGDTKRVITRSVSGSVDDLAMGDGNTHTVEVTATTADYKVGTTQGRFIYYDEEVNADPKVVDTGLKGLAEKMNNDWTAKAIAEYAKAETYEITVDNFTGIFDDFVDAVAKFGEKTEGLFALVCPKTLATVRKGLKDDLKYSEAFVRTGYVGTVAGVPLIATKAVPEGEIIVANKEAVTAFICKSSEMEQDRDADHRKNSVFARKVAVIALTDATKVCRLAAAATTATTITSYTKNTKTVAGAATTGATVKVYVNGDLKKTATAASSVYSVTLDDNLAVNDVVKVIARLAGQVSSTATATVAA